MKVELANGAAADLTGVAEVTVAGRTVEQEVKIPASGQSELAVALGEAWDRLSPGSVPVTVELAGRKETKAALCWDSGLATGPVMARMRPLNLRSSDNAQMDKLFSPATRWRIDYTGAQHGVDRRHPLPLKDERGWVLMNSVMSIFEYGVLPEQTLSEGYLKLNNHAAMLALNAVVPIEMEPNRLLALCCTQPYAQFPSRVTLKLSTPRRAEKLYLLTANLVKTLKCYYPGAEVVIHYADGGEQLHQMIPPYTMPSLIGNICPRAHAVPIGKLTRNSNSVLDPQAFLSLTDVVLDPSKMVDSIELRCVATESLLGVVGATLLDAN